MLHFPSQQLHVSRLALLRAGGAGGSRAKFGSVTVERLNRDMRRDSGCSLHRCAQFGKFIELYIFDVYSFLCVCFHESCTGENQKKGY